MSVEALEKVALVNVDLSVWAGYKRTTESELASIGASLPKDSPLTKGGKKIFPTEFLSEFGNIRKEISRKLSSVGVAAMGGSARAVPEAVVDEINDYLNEIKVRFNQAKVEFDQFYDDRMQQYLDSLQDPSVRRIIDSAKLDRADATAKFGMNWQVFKIVPAGDTEASSTSLVAGMANTLLKEVADGAKKTYETSFLGRPRVTQKALHQLKALRDKMVGLSFLDKVSIDPIVKSIDETLASIPQSGWIEGAELNLLTSIIFKMSNPELMLQHAKLIADGMSTMDALNVTNQSEVGDLFTTEPVAETKADESLAEVEAVTVAEVEAEIAEDEVITEEVVEQVEAQAEAEVIDVNVEIVENVAMDESPEVPNSLDSISPADIPEVKEIQPKVEKNSPNAAAFF